MSRNTTYGYAQLKLSPWEGLAYRCEKGSQDGGRAETRMLTASLRLVSKTGFLMRYKCEQGLFKSWGLAFCDKAVDREVEARAPCKSTLLAN